MSLFGRFIPRSSRRRDNAPTTVAPANERQAPGPGSLITGSSNFKIENSTFTNVHGNATIFNFDSGGPLTEEFRSLILQHMIGSITVKDLDKVEKRILNQVISNIPRANAAYDDYSSENQNRVGCFEGTRYALLLEIGDWAVDPNGPLFYVLFGIAGVGKSTIAQTFAEKADILRLLGASFFFSRDEADRRNAAKFFSTLAFQLCAFDDRFAQAIGQVFNQGNGVVAMTKDPHEQLNAFILEPLRDIVKPRPLPILIVVDALDECDERDRAVIIAGLNRLVQELPQFKVFLTTRPHPNLHFIISNGNPHRAFRLEDIEDKVVDSDIRIYLKHRLSHEQVKQCLPLLRTPWSADDNDIEYLVRAAGQLFIVASTTVRFILDTIARNPASRMKRLLNASTQNRTPLKALNDFYAIILRCALPESSDDDVMRRYQTVLGTISVLENPLTIKSLAQLIDVSEEDICAVLDHLQLVISLGSDDIPIIRHKSFSDYITDPECCKDNDLRITPEEHHTRVAICCLRTMNMGLKQNILGLDVPAQYLDNDEALGEQTSEYQLSRHISADLEYACVYWAMHAREADITNTVIEELKLFANRHLLHWIEALSWMKKLSAGSRALSIVLNLLQSTSGDMHATFFDAFRMLSMFFEQIRCSALHTYHSALPFMPTKRPLLGKYREAMTHQIFGGHEEWDSEIATLSLGGYPDYIGFSPDSSQLASSASNPELSGSNSVTMWDTTSGIPLTTFNGDTIALSGNFSVAASSQGRTVTLCSVGTNVPIATFQHPTTIIALSLSFNGSRLAVGLDNGVINLWDVKKEKRIGIPRALGFDNSWERDGPHLEFSGGGDRLVSVSSQAAMLLNVATGELICCLKHESSIKQFTFFPDNSRLATLDGDALHVWDVENGKRMGVVGCHASNFAVSADGSLLAASERLSVGQVKLWDGDSLSLIDTLKFKKWVGCVAFLNELLAVGFNETIEFYDIKSCSIIAAFKAIPTKFMTFSPDCTRLAGADGFSRRVHLWDVQRTKLSAPKSKRQAEVTTLAFSPDCSRLASGFKDGTVQLWDTTHAVHVISTQKLDSVSIGRLAFSPEGERFVSCPEGTAKSRIWDSEDGSSVAFLDIPILDFKKYFPLAISRHLVAVGTEHEINIWDHNTTYGILTLCDSSSSLSFSPDGSLLASAGSRGLSVTLWDVAKGTKISGLHPIISYATSRFSTRLTFSPDASKLAAETPTSFLLIDVVNKKINRNPRDEDIYWVSGFKQPPIPNPVTHIPRRFSDHHQSVPVIQVPSSIDVTASVNGLSSMFALGCMDGRVFIVRLSTPRN